jgi:beta-glucosidase
LPDSSVIPAFPQGFLWGASTSAHQIEGNNTASDWWYTEHDGSGLLTEPSGDAVDSLHRWPEDMDLLAGAGFTDYRFSIEWARVEPAEGAFSQAMLRFYRAMVDGALERGLRPLLTLHHFTSPLWFTARGGWAAPDSADYFTRYLAALAPVLSDDVEYVCTINEPNILAVFSHLKSTGVANLPHGMPEPDPAVAAGLIRAHHAARAQLREQHPRLKVGWSVAMLTYQPEPGAEVAATAYAQPRQTVFLEAARDDDWLGVQSYTRTRIGLDDHGQAIELGPPAGARCTLTGWEYYPDALGHAVRDAHRISGGIPLIVTENGIATDDDTLRVDYTAGALQALHAVMDEGVQVRGYFHWSLVDNYEWGSYTPTFGLVAVDRDTFGRRAKPSLTWLGGITRGANPDTVASTT